jgi:hypothetical protein
VVARRRYQNDWILTLYRAMQAAIGEQLKIEYELPGELTPELAIVLRKLDDPRHEVVSVDSRLEFISAGSATAIDPRVGY